MTNSEGKRRKGMTIAEQGTKSRLGRCRHFNGVMNPCCAAGVRYDDVADRHKSYPDRLPCLRESANNRCQKRDMPTPEEADEAGRRAEESNRRFETALSAVITALGKRRGPYSGSIPCPCCNGGTLRYHVYGRNRSIHGACSTPGCVHWMM